MFDKNKFSFWHVVAIIIGIIIIFYVVRYLIKQRQPTHTTTISPHISDNKENWVTKTTDDQQRPFILYNFYNPTCRFCKMLAPEWNKVADRLKDINLISVKSIDASKPENENLAFYYNINAYPTIILVTPSRNIEYSGNRTADDLYEFVMKYIHEYQINN